MSPLYPFREGYKHMKSSIQNRCNAEYSQWQSFKTFSLNDHHDNVDTFRRKFLPLEIMIV